MGTYAYVIKRDNNNVVVAIDWCSADSADDAKDTAEDQAQDTTPDSTTVELFLLTPKEAKALWSSAGKIYPQRVMTA